ncbi:MULTISPECIES: ABC transporter ATP-binding protein [Halostella]|uniref:ABC transporter ATP-binding protein n=1 Tax=Halostella TaxID=1843185 RepID=UPI001F03C24C|nr:MULTISPECIES: ABC transporter ATP-binding protein [Halostella]
MTTRDDGGSVADEDESPSASVRDTDAAGSRERTRTCDEGESGAGIGENGAGVRESGVDAVDDMATGGEDEAAGGVHADRESAAEVAVAVEGLRKRFRTGDDAVTAVDGVSFEIEAGAVVGILGPNGAGKTTLIKSVLGMVLPDEGEIRISGVDAQDDPRAAYAHVDAMLEGARNDYWRLTVRENLRYFATVSGVDPDSVADRQERLLDRLELAEKADVPVRDLSRGMKQKVSLASVLAGGADVVFLDEPTLGLDVESARTLQRELRRLATEEGLTVVLSSHDMDVVETVCDRVIVMADGRIVADDAVDALLRSGDDAHRVRIASRDFDRELLAELRDRFDVTGVEQLDPGARVEVTADSEGLYAVMAFLRTRGVTLDRVVTIEPDMEDVFVELTAGDRGDR